MGERSEETCDRSEEKSDCSAIAFKGMRASFSIPARRPRCEGEDTSSLKADWSSWEAVGRCQTQDYCIISQAESIPEMPDCMVAVLDC